MAYGDDDKQKLAKKTKKGRASGGDKINKGEGTGKYKSITSKKKKNGTDKTVIINTKGPKLNRNLSTKQGNREERGENARKRASQGKLGTNR